MVLFRPKRKRTGEADAEKVKKKGRGGKDMGLRPKCRGAKQEMGVEEAF